MRSLLEKGSVQFFLIFLVFSVDRLMKFAAYSGQLFFIKEKPVLNPTLFFVISQNGAILVVSALFAIFVCFLLFMHAKKYHSPILWSASLCIFFGAVSNFIDRIFFGGVIDWITIPGFTAFNIADILIGYGIFCTCIFLLKIPYRTS